MSSISERAPLSIVPTITLPGNGDELLMGRSSNSSHFQLSANRLISRVHVRAVFVPAATPDGQNKVEVTCLGWNGVKIHCQGRTWGLSKGDIFTSDREHDIMLDVHDARVLLSWPTPEPNRSLSGASHSTPDVDESPRSIASSQAHQLMSSPLCRGRAPESPVSPTPAGRATFPSSSTLLPSDENPATNVVSVYEDEPSPDDRGTEDGHAKPSQSTQPDTQPLFGYSGGSQSSALSEPQDFSDPDEENDPTIVSFGPQGDNLLPRIASFTTADSPIRAVSRPLRAIDATRPRSGAGLGPGLGSGSGSSATTEEEASAPLVNHVINQLAYSRLSSTPLSTVLLNLPADLRDSGSTKGGMKPVTKEELKAVLESLPCVGSVRREGKDAAGKPLESEYHYVPDMDTDEKRRDSVVNGLQKPGLRACRKQHKVRRRSCPFSPRIPHADRFLPEAILLAEAQDALKRHRFGKDRFRPPSSSPRTRCLTPRLMSPGPLPQKLATFFSL